MRQGPHAKRGRSRGGNRRSGVPNRNQTFDSNGPDVRIRGNAHQVYEKYLTLARDAQASSDRILAEAYYQHAEHYFRIVNAFNEQDENRQRPNNNSSNGQAAGWNNNNGNGSQPAVEEFPATEEGEPSQPVVTSTRPVHQAPAEEADDEGVRAITARSGGQLSLNRAQDEQEDAPPPPRRGRPRRQPAGGREEQPSLIDDANAAAPAEAAVEAGDAEAPPPRRRRSRSPNGSSARGTMSRPAEDRGETDAQPAESAPPPGED